MPSLAGPALVATTVIVVSSGALLASGLANSHAAAADLTISSAAVGGNGADGSNELGGSGGAVGIGTGSGGNGGNGGLGSALTPGTNGTDGTGGGHGGDLGSSSGGANGGGGAGGHANLSGETGGGGGGGGGSGILHNGTYHIINNSSVSGGNGGNGVPYNSVYGSGGGGGNGITLNSANGSQIVNNAGASITGGNGGGGSSKPNAGGSGGNGIFLQGDNSVIVNAGSISRGGAGYMGNAQGNAISLVGNNNRVELWSTSTIIGNVIANGTSNILALGGSASATFDASALGAQYQGFSGLEKVGSSTWTLTGNGSSFTGSTTVTQGALRVNGALGGVLEIMAGSILGGSGTVGATVIQSGGTLAPGNSIGTLNTGALTYQAGAIHEVELSDSGNVAGAHNDLTVASGLVTIDSGAILRVKPENGTDTGEFYDPGLTYTIITSTVGVTGQFGSLVDDYLFLDFTHSYDAKNVYLTSHLAESLCLAGSTANQCAAADAVQSMAPSALFSAILNLTDADVARAAFDQLSGEMHASATGMLLQDSGFVRDAVNDRLRSAFGAPTVTSLPILAYGEGGAELVAADTDRFAVWGSAFGSWGNNDGDGNAAAFDRSIGGLLMGGDALVGDNWRVGLMTGFSRSSFDVDDRKSSGDATSYHLGAYGGGQWGAVSLRGGAAYSWNSLDTRRAVTIPGLSETLSADYDAGTAQIFGEAAYRIDTAAVYFEPFANLAYVNVRTDAFTETGGSAALSQQGSNTDATFSTLGVRVSGNVALGGIDATARGMVGWRHAFGDVTPLSTLAFAGSDAFTVAGAPIARDAAMLEAGLDFDIAPKAKFGISYTGQFGSGVSDNGAKMDLSVSF